MNQTDKGITAKKGIEKHTLCGANGCCPTVEVDRNADKVVIKDDFGGVVTLTTAEWCEAVKKVTL